MKGALTIILLLFVAVSVTYLVVAEVRREPGALDSGAKAADRPQPGNVKDSPVLVAYYFHGTARCPTCLKIEQYAREAIEETYPSELENGRVRWQAVNYDEPANEHFVKEYGLVASSLVIVSNPVDSSNSWRKLDRTWDLVGAEKTFKDYVNGEVKTLLRSDP